MKFLTVLPLWLAMVACAGPAPEPQGQRFASAEQVELNFHGQSFVLGPGDRIAQIRGVDWKEDRFLKLPFWLGTNILVPGVMAPKQGDYYVISEAEMVRQLDAPNEWLIEAGSSLIKKDTIFVTNRTRYKNIGRLLPTIVQFGGMRGFVARDGKHVEVPVLREVSLPMKWMVAGRPPKIYARFEVK